MFAITHKSIKYLAILFMDHDSDLNLISTSWNKINMTEIFNSTTNMTLTNSTLTNILITTTNVSIIINQTTASTVNFKSCNRYEKSFPINLVVLSWSELEAKYPLVENGGLYKPLNCEPHSAIAIIVPYKNRSNQLLIFLNHMHEFLQRQQLQYGIYIVEQLDNFAFNRGMLMNVGFAEVMKGNVSYDCFVFHDVDLLPENIDNFYGCDSSPRHFAVAVNTFNYKLPYQTIFGGVTSLTTNQFKQVNGFSNKFWGWGGEDDDFYQRVTFHKLKIKRYSELIGRYFMVSHKKEKPNPERFGILHHGNIYFKTDGLNSLNYDLLNTTQYRLYTKISVKLNK